MESAAFVMAAAVGWLVMREPFMRSAKMASVVVACGIAGWLVLRSAPAASMADPTSVGATVGFGVLGIGLAALPYLSASRFEGYLTALPGDDYREHALIRTVRESLLRDPTVEREASVRALLDRTPVPSPEWSAVRAAVRDQLDLMAAMRVSGEVDRAKVIASAQATRHAWKSAIRQRRRSW